MSRDQKVAHRLWLLGEVDSLEIIVWRLASGRGKQSYDILRLLRHLRSVHARLLGLGFERDFKTDASTSILWLTTVETSARTCALQQSRILHASGR